MWPVQLAVVGAINNLSNNNNIFIIVYFFTFHEIIKIYCHCQTYYHNAVYDKPISLF